MWRGLINWKMFSAQGGLEPHHILKGPAKYHAGIWLATQTLASPEPFWLLKGLSVGETRSWLPPLSDGSDYGFCLQKQATAIGARHARTLIRPSMQPLSELLVRPLFVCASGCQLIKPPIYEPPGAPANKNARLLRHL